MLPLPATLRSQIDFGLRMMNRAFALRTRSDAKTNARMALENATTGQGHRPAKAWVNALIAVNATELANIQSDAETGEEPIKWSRSAKPIVFSSILGWLLKRLRPAARRQIQ